MYNFLIIILLTIVFYLVWQINSPKKVSFNLVEEYIPQVINEPEIPYENRFIDYSLNKDIENRNKFENDLNDIYYNTSDGDISKLYDNLTNNLL